MISSTVTVTTTATELVASTPNATRYIWLEPTTKIHIGGANVTTSTGLTVDANSQIQIVLPPLNSLWGIADTGSHSVIVLQPSGDF